MHPLTAPYHFLQHARTSASAFFTRTRMLGIGGWVVALGLIVAVAMLWQSFHSAREANRQSIIMALDNAVAQIQELVLVVEMTAQATERVVGSVGPETPEGLRTALESALVAFRQRPELSHLGVVLPETGKHGNLERAADGSIWMWLYPGIDDSANVTRRLVLTDAGFVPDASYPDKSHGVHIRPSYQTMLQGLQDGMWQLRQHPWMMHDAQGAQNAQHDPPWGISYTKALYDDAGSLIGILDANFDMTVVNAYIHALQNSYDIQLDVIELGETPRLISRDALAPQPVPAAWLPLLDLSEDTFADTMPVNGERHWVTTRSLDFNGGASLLYVASRPVPLSAVISSDLLWQILILALVTAGLTLLAMRHTHRFAQAQSSTTVAKLEHLATHDSMTGLPNRILMQQRINQAVAHAREADAVVALLYLNLDRFKSINDSYGYLFGNVALKAVGAALTRWMREQDTLAYLSGDRFLILLTDLRDQEEAARLTRQLLEHMKDPIVVQSRDIQITASIGVSVFPEHGDTPDALINCADIAMYHAKKQGRDTVQFFTAAMGRAAQERITLENRLRGAVDANQLHLVYQPKVSLASGKIVGCEALVRWAHPELGAISPVRFIPIAEESGLILPIGDWILETACREARGWLDAGLTPVRVAVNLSVGQFLRRDVVTWVADTLRRTGLPAHCLQLELTESLPPDNLDETITTFQQLQSIGVILALDDFGTGYSNLSHLKRFPIHTLKIDQSFVRNALTSPQDASIVRAIIALAHQLNFTALAEGVETEAQLQFLRDAQCDEIQGYYFSVPLAPEIYAGKLRDRVELGQFG